MNPFPSKSAIILIDFINDFQFDRGKRLLQNTKHIIPHIIKLKGMAGQYNLPIIYVNDHYLLWQSNPRLIAAHCIHSQNKEIIEQMLPKGDDYFFIKPKHSAFFQTPLHSLLTSLHVSHLVMAGIAGDICVLFSAIDANQYGYTLHIPENCIASNEVSGNEHALYLMRTVLNAETTKI